MGRTQLALIPPISVAEQFVTGRDCFLFLPQLFWSVTYQHYVHQANKTDSLTILDNGAFEGAGVTSDTLVQLSVENGVDEIVVPDVMREAAGTLELVQSFYASITKLQGRVSTPKQLMAVVQGVSLGECVDFISALSTCVGAQYVTTLGLPRHLLDTTQDIRVRLKLAKHIRHWYGKRYMVHFLGASPLWPAELCYLNELEVRSIDTSMPFVYAYYGKKISALGPRLERPPKYFELAEHEVDKKTLAHNILALDKWVQNGL
jgi:hypothetical protein